MTILCQDSNGPWHTDEVMAAVAHFGAAPGLIPSGLPTTKPGAKPIPAAPGASRNSAMGYDASSVHP